MISSRKHASSCVFLNVLFGESAVGRVEPYECEIIIIIIIIIVNVPAYISRPFNSIPV